MEEMNVFIKQFCGRYNEMTPEEIKARDEEIAKLEEKQAQREKLERYEKSGVPARYLTESLDTFRIKTEEQRSAAKSVADFIYDIRAGKNRILVLLGAVGTGKTHLCCAAIRELGGRYMTAAEIVEEIRHAKSFSAGATEKQIIEKYAGAKLAVMDEIGRSINAGEEKYMIYNFLNALYNLRGSAIITSNFLKKEFLNYIGAASADRLVENGVIIEMTGESYRRELRAQNG
ncbi:ATP-binding protein [uncultured Treponema sp.]|uniref:ATP-binding protein n=1 Tax=uncultured Treponema sp. TaxID=162155 RepID=UPI0025CCCFD7|nr:ATP-binding protein [uncultured Treponema sp.]